MSLNEYKEWLVNWFLEDIPLQLLVTQKAKNLVETLKAITPDSTLASEKNGLSSVSPLEQESRLQLLSVLEEIENFVCRRNVLSIQDVINIFPALHKLLDDENFPDRSSWVGEIFAKMAACPELNPTNSVYKFVESTLLTSKDSVMPEYDEKQEEEFERTAFYSIPEKPRISAAKGLVRLLVNSPAIYPDITNLTEALKQLSQDSIAQVRFRVAESLWRWYKIAPNEMWELLQQFSVEESNLAVLNAVAISCYRLAANNYVEDKLDNISNIIARIFERLSHRESKNSTEPLQNLCVEIWFLLFFDKNHENSYIKLVWLIENLDGFEGEPIKTFFFLLRQRGYLTIVKPKETLQAQVIRQLSTVTWELLNLAVSVIETKINQLKILYSDLPFSKWPPSDIGKLQKVFLIAKELGQELYFASGAFDKSQEPEKQLNLTPAQKNQFFKDAFNSIEHLGQIEDVNLGHFLIEMLENYLEVEPEKIFLQIGEIIRTITRVDYQTEVLGMKLVVNVIQRCLTEFQYIFDKEYCLQTLREVLDIFVLAGWKQAYQLIYELDELFR